MYCIYKITNLINGKTYIGQHKYKDINDSYMGSGVLLHRAFEKYGKKNFKKEVLYSSIKYKETVDDMERFAIAKERTIGKAEYNIADGGEGGCGKHSEETKRKISKSWDYDKHFTEETKKKMSEAHKGKPSWNKGKHHSDDTKKRISEANKGHSVTKETKRKISKANKGKHLSEEAKRKISKVHKGKPSWNKGKKCGPLSEEHKKKLSEIRKELHWFNDGTKNIRAKTCPEGFVLGRLR